MSTLSYKRICQQCWQNEMIPRRELNLPDSIHCSECGTKLGELMNPTDAVNAALVGDTVKNWKTDEVLSEIDYDDERVEELR